MKLFLEIILVLVGVLIICFGIEFKYKSKQSEFEEKALELKTKSILLLIYGCIYELFIIIFFLYYKGNNNQFLPYFLIAFALGKLSYHLLYKHLSNKLVIK